MLMISGRSSSTRDLPSKSQIFNTGSCSSTKPVSVGTECHGIQDITTTQCVQVLALIKIPQHCLSILPTRGTQRTIRRDGYTVKISCVANMVGLQPAVGQIPNLDKLVPAC